MKIKIEELKDLAAQMKMNLSEKEIEQINESIYQITDKLEEILKVDTEGLESTINNTDNVYDPKGDFYTDEEMVDMKKINNFDGTYVTINKENNE